MTESLRAQLESSLLQLDVLTRRGRRLGDALAADPADCSPLHEARIWLQDSAAAINELSGGVKSHWLSRAYSAALLVRSTEGDAVVEANVGEIVGRVVEVLGQAAASLSRMDDIALASSSSAPPARRFDFVHDTALGPVLEQAFLDGGRAFDEGDFTRSLMTSCGIIEAIITDALLQCGLRIADCGLNRPIQSAIRDPQSALTSVVADWPFEARIAAAEKTGLIRGGCARLTPAARAYRELDVIGSPLSGVPITARDAKVARQVLHVVMRDLDPGR